MMARIPSPRARMRSALTSSWAELGVVGWAGDDAVHLEACSGTSWSSKSA